MKNNLTVVVIMFLLQFALNADAASIKVERLGTSNVYMVKGYDFNDIGGVEIEIRYDTAALSNPRITQGAMLASTMFIPNTKFSASSVKIAAMSLSPIKGSDVLATITFDVKGNNPATPVVVRSKLATATGAAVKPDTPPPTPVVSVAPGGTVSPGTESSGTGNTGTAGSGGGTFVSGGYSAGTITLPQDQAASSDTDKKTDYQPLVTDLRKDVALPVSGSGSKQGTSGEQTTEPVKDQPKKFVSYKSTVQLFKDFKGEKSSKSLIPLFAEVSLPDFKQEPPIAFADGTTPLKITLVIKPTGSESPKFMLQGANVKLLSGEGEETITWTINAIPKKDAVEAVLTVIDGQTVMEFPLTIAPVIDPLLTKTKVLSEADFAAYLAKPLKYDFNKDGNFDAIDDFIYTANFIVAMKIKPEKVKKEERFDAPRQGAKDDPKSKEPVKAKEEDKAKPLEKPSVKPSVKP